MRFYNASQEESRRTFDDEANRTLKFYRKTKKDWKKEYKEYKREKIGNNESYSSYAQWTDDKMEQLSKADPAQFKDYCSGFANANELKAGSVAAISLTPYIAVPLVALGMWLAGGLTLMAGLGLIVAGAAVRVATPIVGNKYLARHRLFSFFKTPDMGSRKTKFKLFGREKGEKIIQYINYNHEETKTLPFYNRFLRRAKLPEIILKHFDSNYQERKEVQTEIVKDGTKNSKEDKKKAWYKENLPEKTEDIILDVTPASKSATAEANVVKAETKVETKETPRQTVKTEASPIPEAEMAR